MLGESADQVDLWVADLFGLPAKLVWQSGVTAGMHAGLSGHPGIVVFYRDDAVHVSLPDWAGFKLIDKLAEVPPHELTDPSYWKSLKLTSHHKVHGPQVHAFCDTELEEPKKIERIPASDIAAWSDVISKKKWEASGFAGDVPVAFALRTGDEIASASGLALFRGVPSDVVVLTHPKHRGKGYTARVTRAAASYAVRHHGLARFRYDADQHRLATIAKRLAFEPYFEQLVIVPKG